MHFKKIFSISQIWTASDSNYRIKWVEKWYSCYLAQFETWPVKWKEISNILFRKHDHERVAVVFLNCKKTSKVWKSWDLSWCDGIIHGGYGKKLRRFCTFHHVRCLQTEAFQKKNSNVEKDCIRFGVKMTVEFWFDYKTFYIVNKEYILFNVNFWQFFETVGYFWNFFKIDLLSVLG